MLFRCDYAGTTIIIIILSEVYVEQVGLLETSYVKPVIVCAIYIFGCYGNKFFKKANRKNTNNMH